MKAGRAAQTQSATIEKAETNRVMSIEAEIFEQCPADGCQLAAMGRQKQKDAMKYIVEVRIVAAIMVNRVYRYLFTLVILKSVVQILHLIGTIVVE